MSAAASYARRPCAVWSPIWSRAAAAGELSRSEVREAAARVGVGERTLWRWLAAGRPLARGRPNPTRLVLGEELCDAYLRLGGNVAAVWREWRDDGRAVPPLRTLQAAFARQLSAAERASARRGRPGGASTACI